MEEERIWGYVRETKSSVTDPTVQTPIIDYLETIFPGSEWVHDKVIPKDVRTGRGFDGVLRTRPDFRCERLSLLVEFDGVQHYTEPVRIAKDATNDIAYHSMGYRIVRVPYWLALSREAIVHLFGVDVGHDMCRLTRSFSDNPDFGIGVSTAAFCPTGLERFSNELDALPEVLRDMVVDDLTCVQRNNRYGIAVPFARKD